MPPISPAARFVWLLLAAAGVAVYIAARAAVDALGGVVNTSARPRRLAWGLWMPIAVFGLVATGVGRTDVALAAVLASSVACLTLAAGISGVLQPRGSRGSYPTVAPEPLSGLGPSLRIGTLLLPAALLLFLAGFRGQLTLMHAVLFAGEGVAIWLVASEPDRRASPTPFATPAPLSGLRIVQFAVAIALAAAGTLLAVRGADAAAGAGDAVTSPATVATLLIAPLLVLPILGVGVDMASRDAADSALASQITIVLLNLCLLLPLMIVESRIAPLLHMHPTAPSMVASPTPATRPATLPTSQPTTMPADDDAASLLPPRPLLPFPLQLWRVDGVALVVLGVFLLPIGLGRWRLSREHSIGLIGSYIAYLALTIVMALHLL